MSSRRKRWVFIFLTILLIIIRVVEIRLISSREYELSSKDFHKIDSVRLLERAFANGSGKSGVSAYIKAKKVTSRHLLKMKCNRDTRVRRLGRT